MSRIRVYSTEAIALKRMDFGEADRILTVVTPHYGKLRLMAKGVRKTTSRMGGHLELFAHSQLLVARGRELDVVTQASTIEPFRLLRESLERISFAYHLAELVDGFLQDRDEHPEVFLLLRDALGGLDSGDVSKLLIARHFELHLLAAVGFRPQLECCLACDEAIAPGANAYSVPRGGVFCPACSAHEGTASPIAVDILKAVRFLQRTAALDRLSAVRVPDAVLRDVEGLLRRQLEFVLERRLRAADILQQLAQAPAGAAP